MKELSIEQKAQRYDEAIERYKAKQEYESQKVHEFIEHLFPELKESEDERIINRIKKAVENYWSDEPLNEILAWLEKKGQGKESSISQHEIETCKENNDSLISEDERIRKGLTEFLKSASGGFLNSAIRCETFGEWLAWLEKQGEHANFLSKIQVGDKVTRNKDGVLVNLSQLNRVAKAAKKQDELIGDTDTVDSNEDGLIAETIRYKNEKQKAEPKFHEGEWLVNIEYGNVVRVLNVLEDNYRIDFGGDTIGTLCTELVDNDYHLWAIQDAKDGDVLVTLGCILIFEKFLPKDSGVSYCHYDFVSSTPQFDFTKDYNWYFGEEAEVYPATKEQRDFLFQKIKEAGYEWNVEKKELKKIEQKSSWSEEDENLFRCAIDAVEQESKVRTDGCLDEEVGKMVTDWLNSLKDRVQPQLKQEWSIYDETILKALIDHFEYKKEFNEAEDYDIILWLKSLRPQKQWKPTEEQIKALKDACDEHWEPDGLCPLYTLYEQLKQL